MKIAFIHNNEQREHALAHAFCAGAEKHGHRTQQIDKTAKLNTDADVVCMVGVKSAKLFSQARKQGKTVLFFDKGYFRHRSETSRTWEFWRIAVNNHHPTDYIENAQHSSGRWDEISYNRGASRKQWRTEGEHIMYLGSSAKYHAIAGLGDPNDTAALIVSQLRKLTDRPIYYRPKPSYDGARPVEGAYFDQPQRIPIDHMLKNSWCAITHGSNACFEAVMNGIPCIVLHDAVARPISSRRLKDVSNPYLASDAEVQQWLNNLAWCMFTEEEMLRGLAWEVLAMRFRSGVVDERKLSMTVGNISKSKTVVNKEERDKRRSVKRRGKKK